MNPSDNCLGRIVKETLKGNLFAVLDDGTSVFVPASVAHGAQLTTGDHALLTYVENNPPEDAGQTTKWFCIHAIRADRALSEESAGKVLSVLEAGDAWTAADMANATGTEERAARAFMEANFARGNGAKFVRYSAANRRPDLTYYTLFPERVDVAEFTN